VSSRYAKRRTTDRDGGRAGVLQGNIEDIPGRPCCGARRLYREDETSEGRGWSSEKDRRRQRKYVDLTQHLVPRKKASISKALPHFEHDSCHGKWRRNSMLPEAMCKER